MRRLMVSFAFLALASVMSQAAHADDREIAQDIIQELKELKASGKLKDFNIDLQVDEGTVWLKGHVSRPEQEKLAAQVARRTEGVRRVISKITIRSPRTNEEATIKPASTPIETEEAAEPRTLAAEPQEQAKELKPTDKPANDAATSQAIAKQLVAKLKREQERGKLKGFGIDVEVDKGVLALKGHVSSPDQKYLVVEIARRIKGVKKVVDELTIVEQQEDVSGPIATEELGDATAATNEVSIDEETINEEPIDEEVAVEEPLAIGEPLPTPLRPSQLTPENESPAIDPEEIAQSVIDRLQEEKDSGEISDFGVDVKVEHDGTVWMSGYVASEDQRDRVLELAQYVSGVKQVVNDLEIEEPAELPEEPIGSGTARELRRVETAQPSEGRLVPRGARRRPNQRIVGYALMPAASNMRPLHVSELRSGNLSQTPMAFAPARPVNFQDAVEATGPMPMHSGAPGVGIAPARFDHPQLPGYAWPSYAAHPNYGAVTYPKQYSAQAWPYIGPFYPYPQVPLGWRSVKLHWKDGWWQLDFKDRYFNNR